MDISTTLKCGQRVTILNRSDDVLYVRTDTGEVGFVPLSNVGFFKPGTAPKGSSPAAVKRELTHYDNPARLAAASHPAASAQEIFLANQTPIHLKLLRELSSATAHVGEEVNFEVAQNVVVGGVILINKGAPAVGAVTEAEPKKRGKGGKINVNVASVLLANKEKLALRSFGIEQPADQKTGMSIPLMHGKDVTLAKDTEMTAYVDGDQHLKASGFAAAPAATQSASQSNTTPQ
jgi:hypothetical protein